MFQNKFNLALISTLALTPIADAHAAAAQSAQTVFPAITLSADFSEDAALTMIQAHLSTFKFVSFANDTTCENWLKKPRNFTEKTFTYACQNAFSNSGKTPITLDAISFTRQFVASCIHKPADLETSLLWCHEMLSIIRAVDSGQDSTFEKKITLLLRMERILPLSESAREDTPQLFHNLLTHIIDNESAYNRFVLWANRLLPRQTDKSFSKESYDYLANGIRSGVISTSEALEPLDESNRYLESARLYRIAIQEKSGVACRGLCGLINEGLISRDENNQHIFEDQIPLVIIRLLEKAVSLGDGGARSNLAQAKLLYCTGPSEASDLNRLRSDALNGKSSALHTFSGLISLKKINFDENNNEFEEKDRYLIAARLLGLNKNTISCRELTFLYLRHPHTMQKSTDEEKMVLLLQTIQKSEENVRKVSFNAAYTLYGKRDGAVIFIPDIWSFTEFEWGLYEYLLDTQDEQSITSDDSDTLPLSTSDNEEPESATVETAEKRPLLTMTEFADKEQKKRSDIDESFEASLRRLSRTNEKAKAKIDRLSQTQRRIQDLGTETNAATESARKYTFKQKVQEDLISLGFFKPSGRDTRSDMMYSIDEINKLESAKKTGRGFHKMVNAIDTGEQRAGAETLRYERLAEDGSPLCTMEFNKEDRLVYTISSDGHITIWGALGHDDTINQMRRQGLLK